MPDRSENAAPPDDKYEIAPKCPIRFRVFLDPFTVAPLRRKWVFEVSHGGGSIVGKAWSERSARRKAEAKCDEMLGIWVRRHNADSAPWSEWT